MAMPALLERYSLAVFAMHLPLAIVAITTIKLFTLAKTAQTIIALLVIGLLFPRAAWLDRKNRHAAQAAKLTSPVRVKASFPPTQAAG